MAYGLEPRLAGREIAAHRHPALSAEGERPKFKPLSLGEGFGEWGFYS
jgi:hypothetical protein